MSKAFRAASSLGAVALVLSGAAMAASPTGTFDAWGVTTGTITPTSTGGTGANCPTGFTCATAVTGEGFYQRQITEDSSGNDFFQTIITDKTVTGAPGALTFSDESYVRTGNVSGLADKTQMQEVTTTGTLTETFEGSTELGTGWANGGSNDLAEIYQAIIADDSASGAEDFDAKFWLKQLGAEGAAGKLMRISSQVDIQEATTTPAAGAGSQDFVLVELSGSENSALGTADLGVDGSITWAAGDRIKAIWVGQDMAAIDGVQQEFGFTAYEDFTGATTGAVDTFSLLSGSSAAPVDWDAPTWGSSSAADAGPF